MTDRLSELVDGESGFVSPAVHFDDDIHKDEVKRVFDRAWLGVGHEQMVPSPGSYVANYMGEVPVIVTRGTEDKIHVLVVDDMPPRVQRLVDEIADSDEIEARSAFLVRHIRKPREEALWGGRRIDRLRQVDGSWKIARREVHMDATIYPRRVSILF
jgi:hypothetical protein